MATQTFTGRTEDAAAPFLGSEFWVEGAKIVGIIERQFQIEDEKGKRNNYSIKLLTPHVVKVDGEDCDIVSIGESAGLRMAMQAARLKGFQDGDKVVIQCTGVTPSKKAGMSPMRNFAISVSRTVAVDQEVGF